MERVYAGSRADHTGAGDGRSRHGVCHALRHLPTFWIVGTNQADRGRGVGFSRFIGSVISTAVYSTFCYTRNGKALWRQYCCMGQAISASTSFRCLAGQQRIFSLPAMLGAAVILTLCRVRMRASTAQCVSPVEHSPEKRARKSVSRLPASGARGREARVTCSSTHAIMAQ
jgi:hypothetical protein